MEIVLVLDVLCPYLQLLCLKPFKKNFGPRRTFGLTLVEILGARTYAPNQKAKMIYSRIIYEFKLKYFHFSFEQKM